jgi:hypothetical protein
MEASVAHYTPDEVVQEMVERQVAARRMRSRLAMKPTLRTEVLIYDKDVEMAIRALECEPCTFCGSPVALGRRCHNCGTVKQESSCG